MPNDSNSSNSTNIMHEAPTIAFPTPTPGASLLLSFRLHSRTTLIIGSGRLAATRAFAALEAESAVIILASGGGMKDACDEIKWRADKGEIRLVNWDELGSFSVGEKKEEREKREADSLRQFVLSNPDISLACITDTILSSDPSLHNPRRTKSSAALLYTVLRALRVPVNTTDMPDLCDFTFPSSHRFEDDLTGERTGLQIGVTTNSQGCRLAGRLRREVVVRLPKEVGRAVGRVGRMRRLAKGSGTSCHKAEIDVKAEEDTAVLPTPNEPVPQRLSDETDLEATKRRMKWVAQVSEYWPIPKLANMTDDEMNELLDGELSSPPPPPTDSIATTVSSSLHSLALTPPTQRGKIILIGSGPGHPSLLTLAAHKSLTSFADLVLSDKLVPSAILDLIPKSVEVKIARKFPGNAEGAQNELMAMAVDAAKRGLVVVRLKQGDPSVFGRAGEEILYFRSRGFEPIVIPGVSSALAGPTFAGIPVTQRGVAESFVVCTGVGRNGKEIKLPGYQRERTVVILMGVARLKGVVGALTEAEEKGRGGEVYPLHLPIAIIERASMPDQRAVLSTLGDVVNAMESVGEQRPPGMIVVGWAVLALSGEGEVSVLDEEEEKDVGRVKKWLGGSAWRVVEGMADGWEVFE